MIKILKNYLPYKSIDLEAKMEFCEQLLGQPIPPSTSKQLFERLDEIKNNIFNMAVQNNIDAAAEELQDRMIELYGRVVARADEWELDTISREAQEIERWLANGETALLPSKIEQLRSHIDAFCAQNLLPKKDRKLIASARESIEKASAILRGSSVEKRGPAERWQEDVQSLFDERELAEIGIELFEMSELFYTHQLKEGVKRFNRLSEKLKNRFLAHLVEVGGDPFNPHADPLKVVQALIATAYEVTDSSDGNLYLNASDLELIFQDIIQLKKESSELQQESQ